MGYCVPMFGFDSNETKNLRTRFSKIPKEDKEWTSPEDFIKWAKESGYITGLHLRKHDKTLPHGPKNSFWLIKGPEETMRRFISELRKGSEFCKECVRECSGNGMGCKDWQKYYTENWNKNIHVPPVKPVVQEGPMVFRYEHPDLVREGIVFEGSGRM